MTIPLSFINFSLDLLFPRACLVCARGIRGAPVCTTCRPIWFAGKPDEYCTCCFSELSGGGLCQLCQFLPLPFRAMRYVTDYDRIARNFIRALKYRPSRRLAYYAGRSLGQALPNLFPKHDWDYIVPIPSSVLALRKRGFPHCTYIAHGLQEALPMETLKSSPLVKQILVFDTQRPTQASLPHRKRIRNLFGTMHCTVHTLRDKKILLVDDVITTGATCMNAAHVLESHQPAAIDVIALARSRRWVEFRSALSFGLT